jgi:hypothetical protein
MPIINLGEFDTPARSELNTHVEDDIVVQVCEDPPRLLISLTQGSVGVKHRSPQAGRIHLELQQLLQVRLAIIHRSA